MPARKPAAKKAASKAAAPVHRSTGKSTGRVSLKGPDGLTDQQRVFVAEYLKDRNAAGAAHRAGYSKATAKQQGSRLLTIADVRAAIDAHQQKVLAKIHRENDITLERTLREIARGAFLDPRRLFDDQGNPLAITDLDDDTAACIAGLDVQEVFEGSGKDRIRVGVIKKWKLVDKMAGLDKLMKHLGGYNEDNRQRTDPLTDLIREMATRRSSFEPVRQVPADDADE